MGFSAGATEPARPPSALHFDAGGRSASGEPPCTYRRLRKSDRTASLPYLFRVHVEG